MKAIYKFLVRGLIIFGAAMFVSTNANGRGQVVAWGDPIIAQVPQIGSIIAFKKATAGSSHTVAVRVDGSVQAWGYTRESLRYNALSFGVITPALDCANGLQCHRVPIPSSDLHDSS